MLLTLFLVVVFNPSNRKVTNAVIHTLEELMDKKLQKSMPVLYLEGAVCMYINMYIIFIVRI